MNVIYKHYYGKIKKEVEKLMKEDNEENKDGDVPVSGESITDFCISQLKRALNEQKTAKAISAGLSLQFTTGVGYTDNKSGIEINLKYFTNAACDIDVSVLNSESQGKFEEKLLVCCESGVKVHHVEKQYWPDTYEHPNIVTTTNPSTGEYYTCLPNRGGSDQLSLVGLASVGAMGYGTNNPKVNGFQFGGIQNVIASIRCLTVEKDEETGENVIKHYQIEPSVESGNSIHDKEKWDSNPNYNNIILIQDDKTYNNWVSSIGTYGIITHVFVIMKKAQFYVQNRKSYKAAHWDTKYKELCSDPNVYKFEMYFVPYKDLGHDNGYYVYNAYTIAPDSVLNPNTQHTIQKYGGICRSPDKILPYAAAALVTLIANCPLLRDTLLAPAVGWGLNGTCTKHLPKKDQIPDTDGIVMTCVQALNFETGNLIKTNTMGMCFPTLDENGNDNVIPTVNNYLDFMRHQAKDKGWYATSPVALRFAKKSPGTVSAAGDYDIAWLEQPMVKGTDHTTTLLERNFKDFWMKSVPRVKINWGMYFEESPKVWQNVDDFESFRDMYKKYNSGKIFCNNFTKNTGLDV